MKITALLPRAALAAVVIASAGLAFDALAVALFAATACTWVVLIAVSDYSRRTVDAVTVGAAVPARGPELMPLAA